MYIAIKRCYLRTVTTVVKSPSIDLDLNFPAGCGDMYRHSLLIAHSVLSSRIWFVCQPERVPPTQKIEKGLLGPKAIGEKAYKEFRA